jgi:hypothetical protein
MLSVKKKVIWATAKTINPSVFECRNPAIPSPVSGNTRKAFKKQIAVP